MHNFHYSLSELENMIPWEREVYINLLIQQLKKEAQEAKQRTQQWQAQPH